MNPIRQLRVQAGATQAELAAMAGTSQSTIAAYESGTKSPTLRTMQKLASSVGLELLATFVPRMTREDHRSLAFHRAVAEILNEDPKPVARRAKKNLNRLRELHLGAASLFARWDAWLGLSSEELISRMLDPGLIGREMRQVSPFSGILSTRDRGRILRRFRKEYEW